jgi:hypothetical protein
MAPLVVDRLLTKALVTERARRLRAQYHLQSQGLRSRIQIRINRIPTSLRKVKMGDLLLKYLEQDKKKTGSMAPPAVPSKEGSSRGVQQHGRETTQAHRAPRVEKRSR